MALSIKLSSFEESLNSFYTFITDFDSNHRQRRSVMNAVQVTQFSTVGQGIFISYQHKRTLDCWLILVLQIGQLSREAGPPTLTETKPTYCRSYLKWAWSHLEFPTLLIIHVCEKKCFWQAPKLVGNTLARPPSSWCCHACRKGTYDVILHYTW